MIQCHSPVFYGAFYNFILFLTLVPVPPVLILPQQFGLDIPSIDP
jgi:hypothetical protein